jgi:Xaa-Pro aminopeptidase
MRRERVALEASWNLLVGVTEAEVGDVVMFALADVGGELRGVETLRAGSRSALPHRHAGRKASEPTAPQLYP